MVKVTDKQYYLDPKLKDKLDLMIKRMKVGKDNLLLIDGDEGDGKSNMSMIIGYYVAHTCNREFNLDHVFFDLDKLIDYAIKNKEQVIIWDEGALGGLASEWWNKNQKKFIKLLMIARKRKHFWIVNIPKFFKMNEYFVIDRSIGLVHVYMRGGTEHGRFVYFNNIQKEKLWEDWKRTRVRGYKKWWSFHGSFGMFLGRKRFEDLISEAEYDKKKDEAIMSMAREDDVKIENKTDKVMRDFLVKKLMDEDPKLTIQNIADKINISRHIIARSMERINKEKKAKLASPVQVH